MRETSVRERNKAITYRMFEELWNRGDLDVVDELFSPDYHGHDPTDPDPTTREAHGHDEVKAFVRMVLHGVSDLQFTVEDLIAEGDKVIARWRLTGVHMGMLFGVPPTGVRGRIEGVTIYRIVDGKIVEGWQNWDSITMLRQFGVLPWPLPPAAVSGEE